MKLGIKTTDGVSKLKTKTTDGVAKAVECACCDPCTPGPWGPGYDDFPDTIEVLQQTLTRVGKCLWVLTQCYCFENGTQWVPSQYCPDGCSVGDFWFNFNQGGFYFGGPSGPNNSGGISYFGGYGRTGGDPFPYGIYKSNYTMFGTPQTITINKP